MKYGIDLSHWNGEVDFSQINKDFVILKCNQMTFEDVKFIENYNKAKKESLEIGAYIYVGAMTEYEAKLEAETCVNILNGKYLSLGVWLDLEDSNLAKLSVEEIWNIILIEKKILGGYFKGIYCNKNWYDNILKVKYYHPEFNYWLARIPANDNGEMVNSLNPNSYIWQYSFKGIVSGVKSYVDLDVIMSEDKKTLPTYIIGRNYTLLDNMNVRKSPSTLGTRLNHFELTADGQKHDKDNNGSLDKGTVITCKEVSEADNEIWLRCPSGWICAYKEGVTYVS